MRVAIHRRAGSYSTRWQEYCEEREIPHRLVSCTDDDIVAQLREFDVLLAHWHHESADEMRLRIPIALAAAQLGLTVYPNIPTVAHFDDKVAQKYVLESLGAPLVPTHVFTTKEAALEWLEGASLPLVHKLAKGAGSQTVSLVRTRAEAEAVVSKAFGKGFQPTSGYFSDARRKVEGMDGVGDFAARLRRMPRSLAHRRRTRQNLGIERGYVYFQEFVPDNSCDTRITIIGDRAFGFRRAVRENDFRASGSGKILYDIDAIDMRCVAIAFDLAERMGAQSMAFDFVIGQSGEPLIVEISYGFNAEAVHACTGHWTRSGDWCEGAIWPQHAIIEDVLASHAASRRR